MWGAGGFQARSPFKNGSLPPYVVLLTILFQRAILYHLFSLMFITVIVYVCELLKNCKDWLGSLLSIAKNRTSLSFILLVL
jgi:hypothetical protein